MLSTRFLSFKIILFIFVIFFLFSELFACGSNVAAVSPLTVLSVVAGNVQIIKSGAHEWSNGTEGMTLQAGDRIKTENGSKATVTFFDGSTIDLNNDTEISLDKLASKSSSKTIGLTQTIGETTSRVVSLVDPASRYEIQTQSCVAAVRGSNMIVQVVADGTTQVYNVEGTISITAQGKEILIPVGLSSIAKPGQIPSSPQPGLPPGLGGTNATSISSRAGWQQTGLYLNAGDKYFVEYRGGSWTVDYRNFSYIGPAGYSADIDKTIAVGYSFKIESSVSYGYLLGKVGNGKEIPIGNQVGPFSADVSGFLSLRINDIDSTLGDNDGSITVNLRTPGDSTLIATGSLRQNPPYAAVPAASSALGGYAAIQTDGSVNVSLSTGRPDTTYGVYLETYSNATGGAANYQSWTTIGSLTTDSNGMSVFYGTISLGSGTHYLQIVLSIDGNWGPTAFGTDINTLIVK